MFNWSIHADNQYYAVLVRISPGYSPLTGRLHTCYSPVRRSPPSYCYSCAAPRLACVRPVASVHPEPGSNSSLYLFFNLLGCYLFWFIVENWRGIKKISLPYTTLFVVHVFSKIDAWLVHYRSKRYRQDLLCYQNTAPCILTYYRFN